MLHAQERPSVSNRYLQIAANLLLSVALLCLVAMGVAYIAVRAMGWHFYVIETGSMEPTLSKGQVVAVREIQPHQIKNGDIIAFREDDLAAPVIHRVYGVESQPDLRTVLQDEEGNEVRTTMSYSPRTFHTKGDANSTVDVTPITQDHLIGVEKGVVFEPLGTLLLHLNQQNLMRLGILAAAAFIIWELADIGRELLKRHRMSRSAFPS